MNLDVNGQPIPFIIDSDAAVNLIDEAHYSQMSCKLSNAMLKIYGYGSWKPMNVIGKLSANIKSANC